MLQNPDRSADAVLIFKTSVCNSPEVYRVANWMQQQILIDRWSIDLTDEDHVLKVVAQADISHIVLKALNDMGFNAAVMAVFEHAP